MMYRIGFGGIHIESTTFTSYISDEEDFRVKREEDLLKYYSSLKLDELNISPVPLIMARAIPGGVVKRTFFDSWMSEYTQRLQSEMKKKALDGILLDIHGAMSVEGLDDAEGYLAAKIRDVVGEDILITATMDLHGNVSDRLFQACDLLTCYRTAPHIDVAETKQRAIETMIHVIKNNIKVVKAKVDVPILLPGEKTSTEVEPGKTLYSKLDELCKNQYILDASIWMGFPWADQSRCHSAIVITGTDETVVHNELKSLANYYWSIRNDFTFVGPVAEMKTAINEALHSEEKPFFMSDTGDNPGAGGAGDINSILKEFINIGPKKKVLFSSIFDAESIQKIYEHKPHSRLKVSLGGRVDPIYGDPVNFCTEVIRYFNDEVAGRCAVLRVDNIDIIVTENRYQYGTSEAFRNAGVARFDEYDIIIVKMGYLEPDLSEVAKGWIMALTNGAVNQDLKNINYLKLKRPIYPLEDFEFYPAIMKSVGNKKRG